MIVNIGRTGTGKSYATVQQLKKYAHRNLVVFDVARDKHLAGLVKTQSDTYDLFLTRFRGGVNQLLRFRRLDAYTDALELLVDCSNYTLVIDEMTRFGRRGVIDRNLESIVVLHRHERFLICNTQSPKFLSDAILDSADIINVRVIGSKNREYLEDALDLTIEQKNSILALTGYQELTIKRKG